MSLDESGGDLVGMKNLLLDLAGTGGGRLAALVYSCANSAGGGMGSNSGGMVLR